VVARQGARWNAAEWNSAMRVKDRKTPEKTSGVHRCTPEGSFPICEEAYLFFLAFFFAAILFSSLPEFSRQRRWRSAYTIIMYKFTELSCQEESDQQRRKSEV
jgi:hypothetical protein